MIHLNSVTSEEVNLALKSKNWAVVDTRDSNSFLGWCMDGESVRGHITGATDFSAEWIRFPFISAWSNEEERKENIHNKLIERRWNQSTNIILYDTTGQDAPVVAKYLIDNGYENLHYYNFLNWNGSTTYPPNFHLSVPVQWVKNLMDGKDVPFYKGGPYRIFEVSETEEPPEEFLQAHIPGSTHIWVNEFQHFPEQKIASSEVLEAFAKRHGITADTTVITYAMGYTGASFLLAMVLRYMGVKNVVCINGSSHQWLRRGYPTESGYGTTEQSSTFLGDIPGHPELVVDLEQAKEVVRGTSSSNTQLVDMRSWEQYSGQTSGYDYVEKAGRIPTALWCERKHWYLNPDETIGNTEEMVQHWKSCGLDLHKRNAFFCGAGAW